MISLLFAAAVDPRASSSINTYIGPHLVAVGTPAVQATSAASHETSKQQKLWEESVRITGEDFDFSL